MDGGKWSVALSSHIDHSKNFTLPVTFTHSHARCSIYSTLTRSHTNATLGNFGFSMLPKDILACGQEELAIKLNHSCS